MLSSGASPVAPWPRVRWGTVGEVDPRGESLLDAAERERLAALRAPARRARSLGAAVLMRELLAEVAGCRPEEVGLDRTCGCGEPHGRPVPTGGAAGWCVSASHSGPFVVVAVDRQPVGVDVELVRDEAPSRQLLQRVLAPGEEPPLGAAGFAALWSAKEAYLKALGTGLSTPMASVRVWGDGSVSAGRGAPRGWLQELVPSTPLPVARAHVCRLVGDDLRPASRVGETDDDAQEA